MRQKKALDYYQIIMGKTYTECNPTMIHRTELMNNENEYMDRKIIKEKCRCKFKSTCVELLGALERWDTELSKQLFDVLKNNQI